MSGLVAFGDGDIVVLRTMTSKHLRVKPKNTEHVCARGGKGRFARWRVEVHRQLTASGPLQIKLRNEASGKYLRVAKDKTVDARGGGGLWTVLNVHMSATALGGIKLRSEQLPLLFISINGSGEVVSSTEVTGTGVVFKVEKLGGRRTDRRTRDGSTACDSSKSKRSKFAHEFIPKCLGKGKSQTVVLRNASTGRCLRVAPKCVRYACGLGASGRFAQWSVAAKGEYLQFRSGHSKKYMRIFGSHLTNVLIDVLGSGGRYCNFVPVAADSSAEGSSLDSRFGEFLLQSAVFYGCFVLVEDCGSVATTLDTGRATRFHLLTDTLPPKGESESFSADTTSMSSAATAPSVAELSRSQEAMIREQSAIISQQRSLIERYAQLLRASHSSSASASAHVEHCDDASLAREGWTTL